MGVGPASTVSTHDRELGPPAASSQESYEDWRRQFAGQRLRVLYIIGLIANPVFGGLDALIHPEYLNALTPVRLILELGLLLGFVGLRLQLAVLPPVVLLALWILIGNICIVHMTVIMGGFSSQYYNGLSLVLLAAAVIVPISWKSHLAAQLGTLAYYYGANFAARPTLTDLNALIENSYFLIWTCVALIISVSLYERLQRAEFEARVAERKARDELEVTNRKLLELDRLKSEFFANISHELRTPLTLTLGAFKTLLKQLHGQECQDVIQSGLRNSSRLLLQINELLDLAKFDSGRAQLEKRCFDLAAFLRSLAANFESGNVRRVHLRAAAQPVPIEADPRHLKKVFLNLLANALKFSDPEEGRAWIDLRVDGEAVVVAVKDNGIGIPSDQLDRIFDRFTQVEGSVTRRYEGTGIGLALVKEVVTLHGGTVAVESRLGHGSVFTVVLPRGNALPENLASMEEEEEGLPVASARLATQPATSNERPANTSDQTLPLVLVADDNPDMRSYLQGILAGPYRVVLAKDGMEALELARQVHPALILTDVMMPRMSGYDLLKSVRSDGALRTTPVIFLTARAGTEARIESLEAGADDYLPKPFDEHEVLARVNNLIRARAQERELARLQKEKLARFLPPHLGEIVLSGNADEFLKGHRGEITVVFIDLRGFTAYTEASEPEELMGVLRQYHQEMGCLVAEYAGTLERFTGDAIMVYFNDPLPVPNHVEQAMRMAVAMRERASGLCEQWRKRGAALGVGIGISTGYATLGVVGYEGRQDYAAIGSVTNLAARLCAEAQHGQILISERVFTAMEQLVHADVGGDLTLKGFHRPVRVYNLLGLRTSSEPQRLSETG
jgi:signal transduction histidine kinase/class 3 adenylate cyclase